MFVSSVMELNNLIIYWRDKEGVSLVCVGGINGLKGQVPASGKRKLERLDGHPYVNLKESVLDRKIRGTRVKAEL